MRSLYRTLTGIFVFFLFLSGLQAQRPYTDQDYINPGDRYLYSRATNANKIDTKVTGENAYWDFSFLEHSAQFEVEAIEPPQAGVLNKDWPWLYDRKNVNLALPMEGMLYMRNGKPEKGYAFLYKGADSTGGVVETRAFKGVYSWPRVDPSGNRTMVEDEVFSNLPTPDREFDFPLRYGDTNSVYSSFGFGHFYPQRSYAQNQTRSNHVDGWGVLVTPGDTLACLRVRSEIKGTMRTLVPDSGDNYVKFALVEYKWMAPGRGLPVIRASYKIEDNGDETLLSVIYLDDPAEPDEVHQALITNDAVVLALLLAILALIFYSSHLKQGFWARFYRIVPALLLCYFVPSIFNTLGIISGENSSLYFVASRYLLPTSLVLLTLSIDLQGIKKLGPKAVTMFLTGTVGIMIGGPIAILIVKAVSPETLAGEGANEVWRGLSTVAGSWIGGGANQTAMKEVFLASDKLFSAMIAVDVIVANLWMGFLLYGAGKSKEIDKRNKADASAIDEVRKNIEEYRGSIAKIPTLTEVMVLLAVGFGITGLSHFGADIIAPYVQENFPDLARFSLTSKFFWLIVLSTTGGLALSFTRARKLEGVGASRFGSLFLYVLVATIGMKMDVLSILDSPGFFMIGLIWMAIHAGLMLTVGKLIRAPFFFIAVGSQANVGGAASAPIVASAFHPSLAPVGVLLAVLGYALGTYAAYICALMMQGVSL